MFINTIYRGTGNTLWKRMVWFVNEHYNHSKHQAIFLQIGNRRCCDVCSSVAGNQGWSVKMSEENALVEMLLGGPGPDAATLEKVAQMLRNMRACYVVVPIRRALANSLSN